MTPVDDWVWLAVAAPALAAVIGAATAGLGNRSHRLAAAIGIGGTAVAGAAAVLEALGVWGGQGEVASIGLLGPVDTGVAGAPLDLSLRADAPSAMVALAVTGVALAVQVYSSGYLSGPGTRDAPTRYPAYVATVSLFTSAMLAVVHADDLLLMLIGWEVMGLCSYLLIGHHSERPAARAAALQAFLVTRVGDVGFLLGIVVLWAATGTTSVSEILRQADDGQIGAGTATAAGALLLLGVVGKSAQFPLHGWLPDAMEGPTPVSALIHAATMVAAGVFVLVRFWPVLVEAPMVLAALAVVSSISMVGAALAALVAEDLKRVLAWSTISQIAMMLAGVALGTAAGRDGALAHLMSHAAFKALLFLSAGLVAHHAGSTLLRDLGGLGRVAPMTAVAFGVGLAALAGLPPLSGFVTKEGVLTAAEHAVADGGAAPGWVAVTVLVAGLTTTVLTGVYAARLFVVVVPQRDAYDEWVDESVDELVGDGTQDWEAEDWSEAYDEAVDDEELAADRHRPPASMVLPVMLLVIPTLALGWLPLSGAAAIADFEIDLTTSAVGTLLALFGVVLGTSGGRRLVSRDLADRLPTLLHRAAATGFGASWGHALVVRAASAAARVVTTGDDVVIESYARAPAVGVRTLAALTRRVQTGVVTGYLTWVTGAALAVALGAVLLTGWWTGGPVSGGAP